MDLPGGDVTPTRERLLADLERGNATASLGFAARLIGLVAAAALVDWGALAVDPAPAAVFLALLLGRYVFDLVPLAGRKRKRIDELTEESRFGEHSRATLLTLVANVEKRLGIRPHRYPVYLVRDKSLNAAAVSLGLDSLLGRVDGVYLHRQALHVLGRDELAFVIAHELGHCHRYYLKSTRYEPWNLALVVVAGLAALPLTERFGWLGVFGLASGAVGVLYSLRAVPLDRMRTIEHLCDDFGAQAAGVVNAINALLKIAAESEAAGRVQRFCLEVGHRSEDVDPLELMAEYERIAPFGKLGQEQADSLLAQSLRELKRRDQSLSLKGLWSYLDHTEVDEDALAELRADWKRLDGLVTIDWAKPLRGASATRLDADQIDCVVRAIEANPGAVLARTPEEAGVETTHPATRKRVLYLWKNRRAIESAS